MTSISTGPRCFRQNTSHFATEDSYAFFLPFMCDFIIRVILEEKDKLRNFSLYSYLHCAATSLLGSNILFVPCSVELIYILKHLRNVL